MSRFAGSVLCLVLMPAMALAGDAGADLASARRLLMRGNYAEAAEAYGRLAATDPRAAVGLCRSLAAQGKLDEAARALALPGKKDADLEAESARLAFERGDYRAAAEHVDAAIKLNRDQLLAHWIQGELYRVAGRIAKSGEAYAWLIRYYNEHDVDQADSLRWIGLATARYAEWNRVHDQFHFLVNDLFPEALKLEPDYWPAHYEAGLLFLAKYNEEDASRELKAALGLNPQAAEVHAALASTAFTNRRIDEARAYADRALEINPRLAAAWLVRADLAWANFQAAEAKELIQRHVLPLNPVAEEALGRLAACYLLEDNAAGRSSGHFAELADEVTGRNLHAGRFFWALARWLEDREKLPEAEQYFREAMRRMPEMVGPAGDLGLVQMHLGNEAEARKTLTEAFAADPFNVRVKNMLEVLDVLDTMETVETEHVTLRLDGKRDKLLTRYAARSLDRDYQDLCRRFGYRPPQKPLVEIFNEAKGNDGHQWFSTRLTGLPYLGTVAASTGRVVAMVSPTEPRLRSRFNWARVLRHELVHVVTLQQTHFNIPHWFTEGLAVWSEGFPRPQEWNELLARRLAAGRLYDLGTINAGFTRPNSSDDWQLAYCQAELYVEYMLGGEITGTGTSRRAQSQPLTPDPSPARGEGRMEAIPPARGEGRIETGSRGSEPGPTFPPAPDILNRLLAAYAENRPTAEAILRVFGVSQDEFERGYREYLKRVSAKWQTSDSREEGSFSDLVAAQRKRPNDPDLAARLAYAYLRRGADREAFDLAERALRLRPRHQRATYVMARLHVQAGRAEHAARLLATCLDRAAPDPLALNLLAGLKLKAEKYDEAAALYELGARTAPGNLPWLRSLARVYLMAKDEAKLAGVLRSIAEADAEDMASVKKLAELAMARRDFGEAADWANRAIEIDVNDADAHCTLAEALAASHNYQEAAVEFEASVELAPKKAAAYLGLAEAQSQSGDTEKAKRTLRLLLSLDPKYPGAQQLLDRLEKRDKP